LELTKKANKSKRTNIEIRMASKKSFHLIPFIVMVEHVMMKGEEGRVKGLRKQEEVKC